MKKRYRFLIVIAVLAVGYYFVQPSIQWYFQTPQSQKDMAESSRTQIKVYAQEEASQAVAQLEKLVATNANDPIPTQYAFLIDKAKLRYRSANRTIPLNWTIQNVLQAYSSRDDITSDAEGWYRDNIIALKNLKNQTMQLGLDLRGGMYVTVQLDYATWEQVNNKGLSAADRKDKMAQTLEVLRNKVDQFGLTDPSITSQGDDKIIIEIPGTSDPENVRRFIHGQGLAHIPHRG
jgi:preprotein translocase subunit SecD